jgi:hypothetical protein
MTKTHRFFLVGGVSLFAAALFTRSSHGDTIYYSASGHVDVSIDDFDNVTGQLLSSTSSHGPGSVSAEFDTLSFFATLDIDGYSDSGSIGGFSYSDPTNLGFGLYEDDYPLGYTSANFSVMGRGVAADINWAYSLDGGLVVEYGSISFYAVPEPSTFVLTSIGAVLVSISARIRRSLTAQFFNPVSSR